MKRLRTAPISIISAIFAISCGSSKLPNLDAEPPDIYEFESHFQDSGGEGGAGGASTVSSVAYTGQALRHVLIVDLAEYVGSLQTRLEQDAGFDPGGVEEALLSFYEFDSETQGENSLELTTDPPTLQKTYNDIATGKDLAGKIAGNDTGGRDYKDYSTQFYGWNDDAIAAHGGSISSPDGLMRAIFATLQDNALRKFDGDKALADLPVHVTASGLDLQELTEKLLLGAVAFAQAADDYLDEGVESDNLNAEDGEVFTALEHSWDEAFGYFGASRDYLKLTPQEVKDSPASDINKDGKTDLAAEFNFGPAGYAARRDLGSQSGTTFGQDIMQAFIDGRYLIASSGQPTGLRESADTVVLTWEKVIAASSAHYINGLLADMALIGTSDYDFIKHAQHFSELKGLALSFQFNPRSPLSEKSFRTLHDKIGDAPVLEADGEDALTQYEQNLLEVRATLADVYEFQADDVENW